MKTIRLPGPLYCNDIACPEELNDPQYQKVNENTASEQFAIHTLLAD